MKAFCRQSVRIVLLVFALALFPALNLFAQYRAGIQGVVTDAGGGVVPGAKITLINQETNVSKLTESGDSGVYTIVGLAPGKYNLTVEKDGFSKKSLSDLQITAEQMQAVNIALEVGQVSQTVEVDAKDVNTIDTESATIAGTVTDKEIQNLPSVGRDPFQLMRLAPGVFGDGNNLPGFNSGQAGGIFAVENGVQVSANGGRQNANNFQIDGVGVNSSTWGGAPVVTPNEESVKEVKIIANNYSAENGRNAGAQVLVVSQNGTNELHGSAFFKFHRPGLDAYQRWNGPGEPSPVTRDNGRFNQFGGSVGGPIWKNHLFAFFSYETQRDHSQSVQNGWYETPQFIQSAGSSSSLARKILAFPGQNVVSSTVITRSCDDVGLSASQCRQVSGGLDLGSPLTSALGTFDATRSGSNFGIGNGFDGVPDVQYLQTSSPSSSTNVQYNGRLDYQLTQRDLVAFSSYFVPDSTLSYNGARANGIFHHSSLAQAWTGLWTRTINSTMVNEARFNRSGWAWDEVADNPQAAWGIPSIQFDSIGNISVNGFGAPGASVFNQHNNNIKDTLSKVQGSHSLKFGADISWARMLDSAPWAGIPTYNFHNLWDFANDATYHENSNFDPVTGKPSSFSKTLQFNTIAFFVQDDWKVRPNLTVNLGLRWEDFTPITEAKGNISNVILGSGSSPLAGLSIKKGGGLTNNVLTNFGPQIGFAYSPESIMGRKGVVFRGGFGIGYNLEQLAILSNGRFNPPFQVSLDLYNSNILYALPSSLNAFNAWASNPAAIETFNSAGLPVSVTGAAATPVNVTGFPQNSPTTATYRYSLDAQFDLGRHWAATLGYQGSQTRHNVQQTLLNLLYYPSNNPLVNSVDWYSNTGNARFNALLGEVQHRFSGSFEVDAQYRYAKSLDSGSQDYYQDYYPWNLKYAYGPSDFDTTHNFKLWGLYSPQLFKGSHSLAAKVLGGWTVSGIITAHSGFPWTPKYCNSIISNVVYPNSGQNCVYPTGYNGKAGTSSSNAAFINGTNFAQGALAYYTATSWPTTGVPPAPGINRNSMRGPGFFGNDLQLAKAFGFPKMGILGENFRLNFQANFYNLFNKLNLLNPGYNNNNNTISFNGTTSNPLFGTSAAALPGRVVELQIRLSF